MSRNPDGERVQCHKTVTGPKVGYRLVAWRRQCRNKTRDPSGLCHVHRKQKEQQ